MDTSALGDTLAEVTPPAAGTRTFQCSICSKFFDRKDTLSRHVKIHDNGRPLPKSRKKACIPCFKSKIKCLSERPSCSSCRKRRAKCAYASPVTRNTASSPNRVTRTHQATSHATGSDQETYSPAVGGLIETDRPSEEGSEVRFRENVALPMEPNFFGEIDTSVRDDSVALLGMNLFNSISEEADMQANLSWIFDDFPDIVFPSLPITPKPVSATLPTQTLEADPTQAIMLDATCPRENQPPDLPMLDSQEICTSVDTVPVSEHTNSTTRLVLPQLGELDEQLPPASYFVVTSITPTTRTKLLESIRIPLEQSSWEAVSLDNFPSCQKLAHCIDLYFTHFNTFLPIIHRPTFDPQKEPFLTLAIVCIGSGYTALEGATAFSNALCELGRRLLLLMEERDPRITWTLSYISTQLIQGHQGYSSGRRRLFDCSEKYRSALVNNAKRLGLFKYHAPLELVQNAKTLQERWHVWIKQESLRRLAWAVYEYDSSVSFLHNNRPYITVGDMALDLPCSAAHWEAETCQSWASLHPWGYVPVLIPFRTTIRFLFDNTPNPISKIAEESHRRLIIMTLLRMLWTVKEIRRSPIGDLVDSSHWVEDRRTLLHGINMFGEFPFSIATAASQTSDQVVLIARRMQIVHLANFYGAGDLMDLIYRLVRPSPDNKVAEQDLISWARHDPKMVREIAFHAAQTLTIIRHFPSNLPLEAFNTFHAGVVLWCASALLPVSQSQSESQNEPAMTSNPTSASTGSTALSIRLDYLPKQDGDATTRVIQNWIQTGGTNNISIFGIPDLCSPVGQARVLELTADLLKNMTVWGVAQSLRKAILELRHRQSWKA